MKSSLSRVLFIFALVFAGEMIFSLPFHTTRFFRPTFLSVFDFTNTQLGDAFAFYGAAAMLSYYFGGPLADRYSPRGLMVFSLVATAAGGFYLATIPSFMGTALVYGCWGVTTIFMFWAALIRGAREWGGNLTQGLAFGLLDGGRGFIASAMALVAVLMLSWYLPADANLASLAGNEPRIDGFRTVIYFYAFTTLLAALFVWLYVPAITPTAVARQQRPWTVMWQVMNRPGAWAHALVIVCAYCGYKGLDNYSLYAVQVLGMNEIEAANFSAWSGYLRPVGCIAAGIVADRYGAGRISIITFLALAGVYALLGFALPSPTWRPIIFANLFVSFLAVYALRGLYYALLEETRVPKHLTGTTVGFIAFLGYTPDVFFGPVTGRILDAAPGVAGHQHYFLFLTGVAILGLLAVIVLGRLVKTAERRLTIRPS